MKKGHLYWKVEIVWTQLTGLYTMDQFIKKFFRFMYWSKFVDLLQLEKT